MPSLPGVRDRDGCPQEPLTATQDIFESCQVHAHLLLVNRIHVDVLDDL